MIGVIADPSEHDVVREFFELFKTPWEFYRSDRQYDVVLCAGGEFNGSAKLVIIYSGKHPNQQGERDVSASAQQTSRALSYKGATLPIYGTCCTYPERSDDLLTDKERHQSAAYVDRSVDGAKAHIGYDLFFEIRRLLTEGQPVVNAMMPTLELHIALLRDLITGSGITLVEVPPVPDGHPFIVCLTHDVDHPLIRNHKWDHTTLGFLYRAIPGSLVDFFRGQVSLRNLLRNWISALKLPFVQMGLAKDFWSEFGRTYLKLEKGLPSTFFVIPFKNYPGKRSDGMAPKFRASGYGAREIADTIHTVRAAGCEVALHGLDAWIDSVKGREEIAEIRDLAGEPEIGVRMHWLYFDQQSPAVLEQAGAVYDSTVGYNETVGYRAGTTQVYKPLGVSKLLELPLHAMDTSLFYPAHLGLSPRDAKILLDRLVENASKYGGCLTINWHDRSVAPERLWGDTYCDLIDKARSRGALFLTVGQAVSWFQKRRDVVFEAGIDEPKSVRARVMGDNDKQLPPLLLRIHKARESGMTGAESAGCIDRAFSEAASSSLQPCESSQAY